MSEIYPANQLPSYQDFLDAINQLDLPISGSELHGMMCGYLVTGSTLAGENYIRALLTKKDETATRAAALMLFNTYAISQQQMLQMGFEFQLLLPDDQQPLIYRAQAFSEWCEGFTQGLTLSGLDYQRLEDEEMQEAIQHIIDFGQLDYESLRVDEEDERALMEVTEYTRAAVLHIHAGVMLSQGQTNHKTEH